MVEQIDMPDKEDPLYEEDDIKVFVQDLCRVFDVLKNIDKNYGDAETGLEHDIDKFQKLIEKWNEKYIDIILRFRKTSLECKLDVFFKDDIEGTKKAIKDISKFRKFNEKDKKLEAEFETDDGVNTVTIEQVNGLLKLIYLPQDMLKPESPEFKLCIYYAMKEGYNNIDLDEYFDFSFDLDDTVIGEGWQRRFQRMKLRFR